MFLIAPTLTLAPLELILTCKRSGKDSVIVRVQKVSWSPFAKVVTGVNNQLLIVHAPDRIMELPAVYEVAAPALCRK